MILYIGNNIKSITSNVTTLQTLTILLKKEGYTVQVSASQENQVVRMLAMLWSVIRFRKKASYMLIDTYSTKNFYYALAVSQLARVFKIPYLPILHGGNLPQRLKKNPQMSKVLFANAHINIAPSGYLKQAFEKHGYRVKHIPNVLEIANYQFKQREVVQPKLLYVRAFSNIYNPQLAIKVLYELKKDYPEAKLCMVGPEKDESLNNCKNLVKSLKLESAVEFTGRLSKVEWHKKAKDFDIFINPTNFDNTPVSVMEAMALGLPVVSTNVGGMPHLIANNNEGILVNPDDVTQMTQAIHYYISNQGFTKQVALKAREKVEKLDWEVVKEQWKAILK